MTFNSGDEFASHAQSHPAIVGHAEPIGQTPCRETAGYGGCTNCGCGRYSDDGTGDCYCGHSFGQHYS